MAEQNLRDCTTELICDALEKPLLDDRVYRVVKLSNELEALLIHDPRADKAAAAMDVNIGSFSDPDDMPGMAHAVEHLLFMGTEKYPVENEYSSYLTKYGGHSNAFTASTSTNYYFELSAHSNRSGSSDVKVQGPLYGALDRFAQFFIKPLFLEDTLDRELKAVDSENKKNLQSDSWRLSQLSKSNTSKEHPYSKFSTGNLETLRSLPLARGVKIRDRFIDFYRTHYSANRMKLTVFGLEPLDQLESWVQELFSAVPNQSLPKLRWDDVPLYAAETIASQTFAKPVTDQRSLSLEFMYPDQEEFFRSHPSRYLSHLIGHEGQGSILAYLKEQGWADSLSAGSYSPCPGTAMFDIGISLTDKGLMQYKEVLKVVFQYISLLRQTPPLEWIVDEMKQLSEVDFRFRQKSPASSTVSDLSGRMQKPLPREWLLSGYDLIREFDAERIKLGLAALTLDNFRFTLLSQDFPGDWDKKEKWYGTEYKFEKIPSELYDELMVASSTPLNALPKELRLPGVNAFVPQHLDVEKKEVAEPARSPTLIRNDNTVRTWWKKDDQFWVPKANIVINLRTPVANMTILCCVLGNLYTVLIEDSLEEYSYDASLAGLTYYISSEVDGFCISICGYNDKMAVLLEKVLVRMRDLEITQDRFDIIKERTMRSYKNYEYGSPFRQISSHSRLLMRTGFWPIPDMVEEIKSVTADDVRRFAPQLLRQMHAEVLVNGNLYKEDALNISKLVETTLKARPFPMQQWLSNRSVSLPEGANYVYKHTLVDPANVNHCLEYSLILGPNDNYARRAPLLLFETIATEPCFDTLRTKEQLGYVVSSGYNPFGTEMSWRMLVQSERDCDYLETRCDAFLESLEAVINNLSEEEFEAQKISEINRRLEKLKNLGQESNRFATHISSGRYNFELFKHDVAAIEALTKQEVMDFYKTFIHPASPRRAKLAVHLDAKASSPAEPTESAAETTNGTATTGTNSEVNGESKPTVAPAKSPARAAVLIENVKAWKDSLPLTAAPRPVKDLSEFEELEPKL